MPIPSAYSRVRIERVAAAERGPSFKLPVQCGRVGVLLRPCARADEPTDKCRANGAVSRIVAGVWTRLGD